MLSLKLLVLLLRSFQVILMIFDLLSLLLNSRVKIINLRVQLFFALLQAVSDLCKRLNVANFLVKHFLEGPLLTLHNFDPLLRFEEILVKFVVFFAFNKGTLCHDSMLSRLNDRGAQTQALDDS